MPVPDHGRTELPAALCGADDRHIGRQRTASLA